MPDDKPVFVQLVELLGVAEAVANDEPVIIITIRPDPPHFWRPHNIALTKEQAWRLFADLQNILVPFVLLVAVLATTGCETRVEVESAKWDSLSGERARTQVDVGRIIGVRPNAVRHSNCYDVITVGREAREAGRISGQENRGR